MPQSSKKKGVASPITPSIRRVAVVGTGTIGASWTALFLARGMDVVAVDPNPGAEAKLRHFIDQAWRALALLGISRKGSPEHLTFSSDPSGAVSRAEFVQECVPEDANLKMRLFAELDAAAPSEAIIASSSSSIPISVIQSKCAHPERCIVAHTFDSPHLIPLVEVVGGKKTSLETIGRAMAFYQSLGRRPIHVRKEVMGHIANRLAVALYREVAHLIDQEVVDVSDTDVAVCWGLGLRWGIMGPNLLFHLSAGAGGIHAFLEQSKLDSYWSDLGQPDLTSKLKLAIIDGVSEEVGSRSLEQLGRERDDQLLGLLRLRSGLIEAHRKTKVHRRNMRAGYERS